MDLANSKINNLRDSLADKLEEFLFADEATRDSTDPLSIDTLASTTPTTDTAAVANIDPSTFTWWQNRQKTATGAASVNLLPDMRNFMNTISESKMRQMPNMIITTQTVSELYDDEVVEQRQIVNKTAGDADFERTTYKGIPIMWSSRCPSGRMYMMRSDNIGLNIDPDMNFMMTSWKPIPNQVEDRVAQIVIKLQLITNRRKSLGVMTSIA